MPSYGNTQPPTTQSTHITFFSRLKNGKELVMADVETFSYGGAR
jgi:hypothetical protein